MKKVSIMIGLGILGSPLVSFANPGTCGPELEDLKVQDIQVVADEQEVDLGFDTAQYLPEGFDPYKGMVLNLDDIEIIKEKNEIDLGFDPAPYLPKDFDPCAGMDTETKGNVSIEEMQEKLMDNSLLVYLPQESVAVAK